MYQDQRRRVMYRHDGYRARIRLLAGAQADNVISQAEVP